MYRTISAELMSVDAAEESSPPHPTVTVTVYGDALDLSLRPTGT